jgi:hypothetical protein
MALLAVLASMMGHGNDGSNRVLVAAEMEATWTPNEDEGPALPLSMNQRQQLLQLQQAIQNAPDPNGTLQQVAQSNNMSPNELYEMIEKNAQDLQQDPALLSELQQFAQSNGGGGVGNSIPKMMVRMAAAMVLAIRQSAAQNPRAFSITALSALLIFYTLLAIPRTGLQISSGRSLLTLSSGPTTVFSPPDRYLHKCIGTTASASTHPKLSINTMKTNWDDLLKPMIRELATNGPNDDDFDEEDGNAYGRVEIHQLGRKNELKQAITAQFVLEPDALLKEFPMGDTIEEIEAERNTVIDLLYSNAASVLTERNLVEFSAAAKAKDRIRSVCGTRKKQDDDAFGSNDFGVVVVPGLGNLGRYGLLFWRATSETSQKSSSASSSSSSTLTLTTLKGKGFFDGQIHIDVRKIPQHDGMLLVQVSLAVPKGGRKLHKSVGEKLVGEMARSILMSASRRTKQRLSRQMQGKRFKDTGSKRATDRRNSRFERERLLEEMATERRRRWQKQNPGTSGYRPSGIRQQSPNNC